MTTTTYFSFPQAKHFLHDFSIAYNLLFLLLLLLLIPQASCHLLNEIVDGSQLILSQLPIMAVFWESTVI
jgi:hypothetical protein